MNIKNYFIYFMPFLFVVNSFAQKDTIILQISNLNKETTPIIRPWRTISNVVTFYIVNEDKKNIDLLITRKYIITSILRGRNNNIMWKSIGGLSEVKKGVISYDTIVTDFIIPREKKEIKFLYNNLEFVFKLQNKNTSIRLFELKYIFIRKSRECIFKNNGVVTSGDKKYKINIDETTWTTDFMRTITDGAPQWARDYMQKKDKVYDTIR